MRLLTLLPPHALNRLRASLRRSIEIADVPANAIALAAGSAPGTALVVDPGYIDASSFSALLGLVSEPATTVFLYSSLDRLSCLRCMELSRLAIVEVIVYGAHDESDALASRLDVLARHSVPALLLHGLAERIEQLPEPLASVVTGFFGWKPLPKHASFVASAMRVDQKTVHRWLKLARLANTSCLLASARVARAREFMDSGTRNLSLVREESGFRSEGSFLARCRSLAQTTPRKGLRRLSIEEVARRLLASTTR